MNPRRSPLFVAALAVVATALMPSVAEAKKKGVEALDAPVSGGDVGARNAKLAIMVGGERPVYEGVLPLLRHMGENIAFFGPPGAGQHTKMVNQICIAGLLQGLSEGLAFAKKSHLDLEKVVSVISKGAAQSWQMENRWKQMNEVKFDGFGFAVDWMRKDLAICLEEARRNGARLPVAALVDQFYGHVQARGGRRWDTACLMHLLMKD